MWRSVYELECALHRTLHGQDYDDLEDVMRSQLD
jgi:hypothetical protein